MGRGSRRMNKVVGMLVVTPSGKKIGTILGAYRRNGVKYYLVKGVDGKVIKIDSRLVEREGDKMVYLDPLEVFMGALTRLGKVATKILSGKLE